MESWDCGRRSFHVCPRVLSGVGGVCTSDVCRTVLSWQLVDIVGYIACVHRVPENFNRYIGILMLAWPLTYRAWRMEPGLQTSVVRATSHWMSTKLTDRRHPSLQVFVCVCVWQRTQMDFGLKTWETWMWKALRYHDPWLLLYNCVWFVGPVYRFHEMAQRQRQGPHKWIVTLLISDSQLPSWHERGLRIIYSVRIHGAISEIILNQGCGDSNFS